MSEDTELNGHEYRLIAIYGRDNVHTIEELVESLKNEGEDVSFEDGVFYHKTSENSIVRYDTRTGKISLELINEKLENYLLQWEGE